LDDAAAWFASRDDQQIAANPESETTSQETAAAAELGAEVTPTDPNAAEGSAETETDDEATASTEDEVTTDPDPAASKTWPESARKRIGEITAKRREAEEASAAKDAEIAELRQALEAKPASVPPAAVPGAMPLAHVMDPRQLESELDSALSIREWVLANPEGGDFPLADGSVKPVSAEDARAALARTDRMINQHIPQRKQWLAEHAQHAAKAREVYPDLFKKGTEENVMLQNLIQAWPEVTRFVDFETIAGRYIRGMRAEQEALKGTSAKQTAETTAKKPNAAKVLAPSALKSSGGAMTSSTTKAGALDSEARSRANRTGSLEDVAAAFATARAA